MARRGDLVLLSHDTLGTRYAFSRIRSISTSGGAITSITLDDAVEIPAGPGDLFSLPDLFFAGPTGPGFEDDAFDQLAFGGQEDFLPAFQEDAFDENVFGDGYSLGDLFALRSDCAVAIRRSNGTSITCPVTDPAGGAVLTFTPPIPNSSLIVPGCVVAVGARGMESRRCIVFDVQRTDLETATVTLVDEAPQLHR